MKIFDFSRLIRKYSVTFVLRQKSEGRYESGKWVDGESTEREMQGAIIPLPENKIYHSGGTYTAKDRQLFMKTSLDKAALSGQVIYKNDVYSVEQETDYSDYVDAAVYVLRWVSAFDRKQK